MKKKEEETGSNINILPCCPALPQEKSRSVPVRSSSEYGRHPAPIGYQKHKQYGHVACIKAEFFMKNGIVWNVAEGYGSVAPTWKYHTDESVLTETALNSNPVL